MPNKPEGVKKSAKQAMEERWVEMAAEFARLQEAVRLEEEEEHKQREEEKKIMAEEKQRAAVERKREEEQKQRDIAETRRRVLESASLGHVGASTVTRRSSNSEGPEKFCSSCVEWKRDCTWTQAFRSNRGKKRQQSPAEMDDNMESISNPQTMIVEEGRWMEYDNQAWVATANDIVAALARTNGLLEWSIVAVEGSRAAMDRFMEEQRAFRALFLEGMRNGFHAEVAEEPEETEEEAEGGSGAGVSGRDMETDDL
ncbi:uncharacterized protein EDB91DRAFT_1254100 [Suillus paluster]|uniref:uncharacterized protein n=1 Tax=Suillus paluster TaxID=48578 RepID=UPI001B86380B|nr:uncharacterized protein EDB91DRAFT_1254100 [Suillus paluster]KAG1726985.1 hypothetical protein EDB91DRAFT_1254100 [Suillus paluster]